MESWQTKGHTRRPNAIVRGIYAAGDWLADFGPMFNTAKQGAINTGLLLANLIIVIGIVTTSAVHSLQLLRYAGAKGGLEYVLLIVWESVFIISSFLLDQALQRGMGNFKKSWQVWIPFLLGLTFVFFSNFIGMASNLAGMLLGGVTPFLLLFTKWMLGWQLHERAEFDEQKKQEKAEQILAEFAAENDDKNHKKSAEPANEDQDETGAKNETEIGHKSGEKTAGSVDQNASENPIEKVGDKNRETPDETRDLTVKNTAEKSAQNTEKTADEKAVKTTAKSATKTTRKNPAKKKKSARKSTKKNREKIVAKTIEKALQYEEIEGELPSQNALATLAKTSRYYASIALDEISKARSEVANDSQEQQEEQRQAS